MIYKVDMFIVIGLIIVNNNEMTYKGIFKKNSGFRIYSARYTCIPCIQIKMSTLNIIFF